MMKYYEGWRTARDEVKVSVVLLSMEQKTLERKTLPLRLDLVNHSPTGFEWGYNGSGPAQLAIAILADAIGDEQAKEFYQDFKNRIVARLPRDKWQLTAAEVIADVDDIKQEQAWHACTGD